jgi:hypothetical protein
MNWAEIYAKQYGNLALKEISEMNLPVVEFKRAPNALAFKIQHLPSRDTFSFGDALGGYVFVTWTEPGKAGETSQLAGMAQTHLFSEQYWKDTFYHFRAWLVALRAFLAAVERHKATPDLWSAVQAEKALVLHIASIDSRNAPFNVEEQLYISQQLRELKEFIASSDDFQRVHFEAVEASLKYLEESAARLGRKDWLNCLFTVLMGIVISCVFAPDRARELFAMALGLFNALFEFALQLPSV